MSIDEAFKRNVTYKKKPFGHSFECRKGLFGVISHDKDEAEREARNYFRQYYEDGEYKKGGR